MARKDKVFSLKGSKRNLSCKGSHKCKHCDCYVQGGADNAGAGVENVRVGAGNAGVEARNAGAGASNVGAGGQNVELERALVAAVAARDRFGHGICLLGQKRVVSNGKKINFWNDKWLG
uniref:Uncharacterized protein n=1 Tax=Fagus sylvatica TaxID=28930 RepID=A0A2N9IPJ1_FAGSY